MKKRFLAVIALLGNCGAFRPQQALHGRRRVIYRSKSTLLEESAIVSLFGALSNSYAILDPSDGTCCRNGCSGCQFFNPETSMFQVIQYSAEKHQRVWIPSYATNKIGHLTHTSRWAEVLFGEGGKRTTASRKSFNESLAAALAMVDSDAEIVDGTVAGISSVGATVWSSEARPPPPAPSPSEVTVPSPVVAPVPMAELRPAMDALWRAIGSRGSPVLSRSEAAQRFSSYALQASKLSDSVPSSKEPGEAAAEEGERKEKRKATTISLGVSSVGGGRARALRYDGFRLALLAAADEEERERAAAKQNSMDKGIADKESDGVPPMAEFVDYESMESPALLGLCSERGISSPPPMKRLIIEELRFFDQYGRAGKRNKRTRQLE